MRVVHVGPVEGPHIPVTLEIPYDDHLYVPFPPTPQGQDRFRHKLGFFRKLLRTYSPKLLAVHWDAGIAAAVAATRFEGGKVVVHRYLDQPLKSGIFRRQMYKRIAAFVVDGDRGQQHLEAVKPSSPVLMFRPPPDVPEPTGRKMGANTSLTIGVVGHGKKVAAKELSDIRSCVDLLVHGGTHRWVLYDMPVLTTTHASHMEWADVLHLSDVLLFFAPPSTTYPRKLMQALELGKRCLCCEDPIYEEFAGDAAHYFPKPLPGYIVKEVGDDAPASAPALDVSNDYSGLIRLYKELS